MNPEYLDTDDLVDPATGLLGSAAARPQATAFGEDAYSDLWTKAAALLHSIVKNHARRWQQASRLARHRSVPGGQWDPGHVSNDAVYDFVIAVTIGRDEVAAIAADVRLLVEQ